MPRSLLRRLPRGRELAFPLIFGAILTLLVAIAVLSSVSSKRTSDDRAVQVFVTGREFAFEPSEVRLKVGEPVALTFSNEGTIEHDMVIPEFRFQAHQLGGVFRTLIESFGHVHTEPHGRVVPGEVYKGQIIPNMAATFTFFCSVPGHRDAGMVGKVIVTNDLAPAG